MPDIGAPGKVPPGQERRDAGELVLELMRAEPEEAA